MSNFSFRSGRSLYQPFQERCVDRVWASTRGRGVQPMWTHVDRERGSKTWFFVDVINGWPHRWLKRLDKYNYGFLRVWPVPGMDRCVCSESVDRGGTQWIMSHWVPHDPERALWVSWRWSLALSLWHSVVEVVSDVGVASGDWTNDWRGIFPMMIEVSFLETLEHGSGKPTKI